MQTNTTRIPQWLLPYLQAFPFPGFCLFCVSKMTKERQTSRAFPRILKSCKSMKCNPNLRFMALVTRSPGSGYGEAAFYNNDKCLTFPFWTLGRWTNPLSLARKLWGEVRKGSLGVSGGERCTHSLRLGPESEGAFHWPEQDCFHLCPVLPEPWFINNEKSQGNKK